MQSRFLHIQIYNETGTEVEYDNLIDTDWGIQTASASLSSNIMETELRFGNVFSSMFQVTLFGLDADLRGRRIKVGINYNTGYNCIVDGSGHALVDGAGNYIVYRTMADVSTILFNGYIATSKKDRGGTYREILAYDILYSLRDLNVADFWTEYWTDLETSTLADFRDALIEYVGLTSVSKTLLNDDLIVQNYFEQPLTQVRFQDLLKMVCELQNCCPHINADEQLEFITLDRTTLHDIRKKVEGQNSTWEDFTTEEITGVAIYSTGDELSQVVGEEDNVYNIVGNVFLMGMTAQELTSVATSLLDELSTITFVPGTFKLILSEPSWKLGEMLYTEYGIAYILDIRFSGSVLIDETITCRQTDAFLNKNVDSHNDTVIEGLKLASVTKTVDSLTVDYADFKEETETTFEQTASEIVVKVDSKGNVGTIEFGITPDPDDPDPTKHVTQFEINADFLKFIANKKLDLKTAKLNIESDGFSVTEDGEITATSGTIGGFEISDTYIRSEEITGLDDSSHNGVYLGTDGIRVNRTYGLPGNINVHYTKIKDAAIDTDDLTTQFISIGYNASPAAVTTIVANFTGNYQELMNVTAHGNFWCNGTKSRIVETVDYGDRLLYCYETPTPMFGDIGEGTIAEDGKCYVWLDPVFAQTIDNINYQVFLQKYGQGECWVSERTSNYFIVEGTQGLSFGWELKAKQVDFSQRRLDQQIKIETDNPPQDYGKSALEHIQTIQSEREVV